MPAGILSAFLFCLLTLSSACYIINCPRGGKRSLPERECTRCGSDNSRKCFGPYLCCAENGWCTSGADIRQTCQRERLPCQQPGRPCGGECRARGQCCKDDMCIPDPSCPQTIMMAKIKS